MNVSFFKTGLIFLGALYLCLMLSTGVLAESDDQYYVRLQGTDLSTSGDFDGEHGGTFINAANISVIAPKLTDANGYGFTFGGQRGRLCGEVSYLTSEHDSSVDPLLALIYTPGQTEVEKFCFDVKFLFTNPQSILIPYGLIGVTHDIYKVQNGALNTSSSPATSGEARYWGYGYKLGLGVLFRLADHLALESSYTVSSTELRRVKAFEQTRVPDFTVEAQSLSVSVNYYF